MELEKIPTDGSRAHFAPVLPELPAKGGSLARMHFDSLAELAAMIPAKAPYRVRTHEYWIGQDESFYGKTSMTDALNLARDGWQEGADRALPLLDRVNFARPTKRALVRYDVAGAVPSVPRYLAGAPLHMRNKAPSQTSQRPIITLVSSTAAPWFVEPETFEAAAVAALAIVDRLEDAGFRVEIIAGRRESNDNTGTSTSTGQNNRKGDRSEIFFRLKAAQDPLDVARVAFGIGHPAVYRRLLFAAGVMHPDYEKSLGSFQGFAVALTPLERPVGTYILPALAALHKAGVTDPIKAFDTAIETLRGQGCPGLE